MTKKTTKKNATPANAPPTEVQKAPELKWRLSRLPSVEELQALVKDGLITKDEARSILFKDQTEENQEVVKAQSEEIKFLKELVDRIAEGNNQIIIRQIERIKDPYINYSWYYPYYTWSDSGGHSVGYSTTAIGTIDGGTAYYSASSTQASSEPISFKTI